MGKTRRTKAAEKLRQAYEDYQTLIRTKRAWTTENRLQTERAKDFVVTCVGEFFATFDAGGESERG